MSLLLCFSICEQHTAAQRGWRLHIRWLLVWHHTTCSYLFLTRNGIDTTFFVLEFHGIIFYLYQILTMIIHDKPFIHELIINWIIYSWSWIIETTTTSIFFIIFDVNFLIVSILFIFTMAKTRLTTVIIKWVIILRQVTNSQTLFVLFKNFWLPLIIIKDHSILSSSPVIGFANFTYNSLPSWILILCNILYQNIAV